jgi:hypothetical protein
MANVTINRAAILMVKATTILTAILKYLAGKVAVTWRKIRGKLEESQQQTHGKGVAILVANL